MTAIDLLLPLAMAAAAGLVGSIAVMRRMALASDAMSHVALPGIGLALLLHLNPMLGGFAALLAGTVLIWGIERRSRIPTEAVIGVIFSAALAIGSMMSSGEELVEALFGSSGAPSRAEVMWGLLGAAAVIVYVVRARSRLVISLVSRDLARTTGIHVARGDLVFLLAFGLTVALGLRYLGVLLMGSLIIIPAVTAMHLARGLRSMQWIAVAAAIGVTLAGTLVAPVFRIERGPLIIAIAAAVFLLSLAWRRA